jgi:hypothetical protein
MAEQVRRVVFVLPSALISFRPSASRRGCVPAGICPTGSRRQAAPTRPEAGYGSEGGSETIEAYLNTKFGSQAGL